MNRTLVAADLGFHGHLTLVLPVAINVSDLVALARSPVLGWGAWNAQLS